MSIEYLNLAWATPMPPLKKLVFISLADQANGSGACYPSIGYIEKRTGLSRRSVIRSIQWLEEQGFLTVSRQDRSRNYYQINASATLTPPSATLTPPSATLTPDGCHTDTRTSATQTPKPLRTINEPPKNQSIYRQRLKSLCVPDDLIDEWLAIRKKHKGVDSERAFNAFMAEVEKSGLSVQRVIEICCTSGKGWVSFKAEWVTKDKPQGKEDFFQMAKRIDSEINQNAGRLTHD